MTTQRMHHKRALEYGHSERQDFVVSSLIWDIPDRRVDDDKSYSDLRKRGSPREDGVVETINLSKVPKTLSGEELKRMN